MHLQGLPGSLAQASSLARVSLCSYVYLHGAEDYF